MLFLQRQSEKTPDTGGGKKRKVHIKDQNQNDCERLNSKPGSQKINTARSSKFKEKVVISNLAFQTQPNCTSRNTFSEIEDLQKKKKFTPQVLFLRVPHQNKRKTGDPGNKELEKRRVKERLRTADPAQPGQDGTGR